MSKKSLLLCFLFTLCCFVQGAYASFPIRQNTIAGFYTAAAAPAAADMPAAMPAPANHLSFLERVKMRKTALLTRMAIRHSGSGSAALSITSFCLALGGAGSLSVAFWHSFLVSYSTL
ncbi:MAG: hypothetical protein H7257_08675 [Taibaiella sp.]|nr:hypothetical protein [Taibaiella sp.]